VSLIEKAYAKLHNCYQSLTSGTIENALMDLTGYATSRLKVSKYSQNEEKKKILWQHLLIGIGGENSSNSSLMGCSSIDSEADTIKLEGENTGILKLHAYSILDVFEIVSPCFLINL